jgi:ABC-type antimicrobial peptide transport system permease subunit
MDEQIGASLVGERLLATLSVAFAILAMVLASVGLYGVMSYEVARRARDTGIRLALGARTGQILRQVLLQVVIVTSAGIAAGAVGAIVTARTLATLLYGLAADDAATLLFASLALGGTALLAGYLPARRAASVDPAITLRAE